VGHLAQFTREGKASMHFGSQIMSFESIIGNARKASNLISLITSIVFNNPFGVENHIYWAFK